MHKRGQGSSPEEEPATKHAKPEAARSSQPSSSGGGDPHALLDPTLVALREELVAGLEQPLQSWPYHICYGGWFGEAQEADPRTDRVLSKLLDLQLVGSGAEGLTEARTSRMQFAQVSGYYRNAVEFGDPGTQLHLDIGHAGLLLLLDAVHAPRKLQLTALSAIDLLQAALYLQVTSVTKQVLSHLISQLPLHLFPALLRLPAALESSDLVDELSQKVEALFTKLPLGEWVQLLAALPEDEVNCILNDDMLQTPTRCRVLQVVCELAKVNERLATSYLSPGLFLDMSYGELEACGLYLQTRPDLPVAFSSAAMLHVIAALASRSPSEVLQPRINDEGNPEQVLAAWVPCEGAASEGKVLQARRVWEVEYHNMVDVVRPELSVTPADAQVPGSKMALALRPLWEHFYEADAPSLPAGFTMRVFAFTADGFTVGRLGPTEARCAALADSAFLSRVSGSAFVCPDGRRRLLVGVEG